MKTENFRECMRMKFHPRERCVQHSCRADEELSSRLGTLRRSRAATEMFTMLCGAFLCVLLSVSQAGAEPMTLETALAAAYLSNPQLEAQRAALRATDEEVAKALAGWRPSVGGTASYGWQNQNQTLLGAGSRTSVPQAEQLTITQTLFNGRTVPSVSRAKQLVSAGREQLRATEQTVLLNAAMAYFSVLRDQEIVEAYREDLSRLRDIQRNTEARLRIGDLTKTDASLASARLLGSQISFAAAQQQLAASRAAFEHHIGRPAESLREHAIPNLPHDPDGGLRDALANHPALAQKRAEAEAARTGVDVATGALLPTLSVQAQYGRSIDTIAPGVRANGLSVLGQLNIPFYQGGAEQAGIRQAKEQSSQALLMSYETERQVREDFTNAWNLFNTSQDAAALSVQQAAANESAYLGTTVESRVGSRNIIDILNAEQELLQAKINAISQRASSIVAAYRVVAATGRMTAADLKLPVPLYSPADHYDQDATKWFGLGD